MGSPEEILRKLIQCKLYQYHPTSRLCQQPNCAALHQDLGWGRCLCSGRDFIVKAQDAPGCLSSSPCHRRKALTAAGFLVLCTCSPYPGSSNWVGTPLRSLGNWKKPNLPITFYPCLPTAALVVLPCLAPADREPSRPPAAAAPGSAPGPPRQD